MNLEQRVEALERSNRRLRRVAMVLGLGLAGLVAMGVADDPAASIPDVVRAHSFEVVGADGTPVAALRTSEDGSGSLVTRNAKSKTAFVVGTDREGNGVASVYNREGRTIVRFGATEFGGMMGTYDDKGRSLAQVSANGAGQGTFALFNANKPGVPNVAMGATENLDGMVATYNSAGQRLVQMTVTQGGVGKVTTYDGKGAERVELGCTATGGFVGTFGADAKVLTSMSTTVKGDGIVRTYTADGLPLCGLEVDEDGMPRFAVYGDKGQIAKVLP